MSAQTADEKLNKHQATISRYMTPMEKIVFREGHNSRDAEVAELKAKLSKTENDLRESLIRRDELLAKLTEAEARLAEIYATEPVAWKVTQKNGEQCYFGNHGAATAYARQLGTVQEIKINGANLSLASPTVNHQPVVATDHPDIAGGIVWSRCELEWINTRIAKLEQALALWKAASEQAEESELDDCIPHDLFNEAYEATK